MTPEELPPMLRVTPSLDRWLTFTNGEVIAHTGRVELGQGVRTAIAILVAEQLEVALDRVVVPDPTTASAPIEGVTAGSMSMEVGGAALRQAAAWAKRLLLKRAAEALGCPVSRLTVRNGELLTDGEQTDIDYWDVAGDGFDFEMVEPTAERMSDAYPGHVRRVDLEARLRGGAFVHDVAADLHARVVRPPSIFHRLLECDATVPAPGRLIRRESFIAVAHPDESVAIELAAQVAARSTWRRIQPFDPAYPDDGQDAALAIVDGALTDTPARSLETELAASYSRPFLLHGSIGPSAASARFVDGRLTIETASQGIGLLPGVIGSALDLDASAIDVQYVPGSGCYGHNGADDAAFDAAFIALACPGEKVLLKWSRRDEHRFEPCGSMMHLDMGATVRNGGITAWSHEVASYTHVARPSPGAEGIDMIGAWFAELGEPSKPVPRLAAETDMHRNAVPLYTFDEAAVSAKLWPDPPVRTSALRGLGAQGNVFAIESFMDEIAHANQLDPIVLRRRHLENDQRAIEVMDAVIDLAGGLDGARGFGIARYKNRQSIAAVVAEVEVDAKTAVVAVRHLWIAAYAGRVIDHDGLIHQLEGGAVQAVSWCLKEAVEIDDSGVVGEDWDGYPILGFSETPTVDVTLIDDRRAAPLGAGEVTVGPTSAALGNAVFAATGIRVRDLPLTPDALRRAASG